MKAAALFMLEWFQQVFIALDQACNAFLSPLVTGRIGFADETLSARCGRGYLKGRILSRLFLPLIDLLFAWQTPDPSIKDATGKPERSHCIRAYRKEILRRQLPPEYR